MMFKKTISNKYLILIGLLFTSLLPLSASAIGYTYDSIGRLTHVAYDNGDSLAYSYDAAGNITSLVSNASFIDTDNDGLPDAWENLYDLNPLDPDDAYIDSDLDGVINIDEYEAGTDPTDSSSVPTVFSFSEGAYTLQEEENEVYYWVRIQRLGNSNGVASVLCTASQTGNATLGLDYSIVKTDGGWSSNTTTDTRVEWADGNSSFGICTVAIKADAINEGAETFTLTLSDPEGGQVGYNSSAQITITESGNTTKGDFGGDNKADILIRNSSSGQLYLFEMDGNAKSGSSIGALSTDKFVAGLGDLGGDGKTDIVIRDVNTGDLELYEMDGNTVTASDIGPLSSAWNIQGVADLGGDGKDDLVLRNEDTGQLFLYEMNGNARTGSNIGGLSLSWNVVGLGDLNGDGKDDIIIRHDTSGQLYLYTMDGNQRAGSNIGGLPPTWEVVGIADVGGDGKGDIIVRNIDKETAPVTGTGQLYLYEMDGNTRIGSNIGGLPLAWTVERMADYGGDGKADMLIRNTNNGQLYLYEMDGSARTGSNIGGLDPIWNIQVK